MTDKDHVFSRFQKESPSPTDRHEQRTIPRKGYASGSRVVEVVLVRSGGTAKADREEPRARHAPGLRAAAWEGGFPARPAARQETAIEAGGEAPGSAPPAVHVMPMWGQRAAEEEEREPAAEQAKARAAAETPGPRKAGAKRRIADPFDAHDTGANCLRCGYVIEPDRERRGLMTCAACG